MSSQSERSNIIFRPNVCQRRAHDSLQSDTAYIQRIRGGHSIKLVARAIVMAANDCQVTAFIQQSTAFTPLQKQEYADRCIRATGSAAYGWDLDADGRIVWKPVSSLGSRLLVLSSASVGTTPAIDACWFVAPDGRIKWGTPAKKSRPLLQDKAQS